MHYTHLLTADLTRGQVTIVRVVNGDELQCLRISPSARMNNIAKVEENDVLTRIYDDESADIHLNISHVVATAIEPLLIQWAQSQGVSVKAIGWSGNTGTLYTTEYDRDQASPDTEDAPEPTKRRRIMLG